MYIMLKYWLQLLETVQQPSWIPLGLCESVAHQNLFLNSNQDISRMVMVFGQIVLVSNLPDTVFEEACVHPGIFC